MSAACDQRSHVCVGGQVWQAHCHASSQALGGMLMLWKGGGGGGRDAIAGRLEHRHSGCGHAVKPPVQIQATIATVPACSHGFDAQSPAQQDCAIVE